MPDPAPASSSAGRGSAPLEVHRDTRRGTVLVLIAAVGWSLAGLFTRSVAASSWAIIGWRGVFSAVAVVGWLVVGSPRTRPRLDAGTSGAQLSAGVRPPAGFGPSDDAQLCAGVRPPTLPGSGRRLLAGIRVGWGGLLLATLSTTATALYIPALQSTSVANVVVVYATAPFLTTGLAWLVLRERPARRTLAAATGAVVGVAMTAAGGIGGGIGGGSAQAARGLALAAGMTLALAGVAVCGRRFRTISQVPATAVSALQLAVLGLLLAPDRWLDTRSLAILAVFGTVQALSLACYVEGARLLPASRAAVLSTADVPLAPLWVWAAFGEVPAGASVAGGLVVLAAVLWDAR